MYLRRGYHRRRGNMGFSDFMLAAVGTLQFLSFIDCAVGGDRLSVGSSFLNSRNSSLLAGAREEFQVWMNTTGFAVGFSGNNESTTFSVASVQSVGAGNWDIEIVWTANVDLPLVTGAVVALEDGGNLVIRGPGNEILWSSMTDTHSATTIQLLATGNLVLLDEGNATVWQSFDYPTDTLLEGQNFTETMKLTSTVSDYNSSQGPYYLKIDVDGMALSVNMPSPQQYWKTTATQEQGVIRAGIPMYARLETGGYISMYQEETVVSYTRLTSYNQTFVRRMKVQPNGNLRVFYWHAESWNIDFEALEDSSCQLPKVCGPYGICNSGGECSCPEDEYFKPLKLTKSEQKGCAPVKPLSCNTSSGPSNDFLGIIGIDYFAIQFASLQSSMMSSAVECRNLCSQNCSCLASFYYNDTGSCFQTAEIGSLMVTSNVNKVAFIKVQDSLDLQVSGQSTSHSDSFPFAVFFVGMSVVALAIVLVVCSVIAFHKRRVKRQVESDEESFFEVIPGLPPAFTYHDIRLATRGFLKKLGTGVFGSVYEGVLPDGIRIVVKTLEGVAPNKQNFMTELAIAGTIVHPNVVKLRGYCLEGAQGLLVYDYMLNGSLDNSLFQEYNETFLLQWETRYNIALDIAHVLTFLHEECGECILLGNLKPGNILLDEHLKAKVSEVGLLKLFIKDKEHSRQLFVNMRNSQGYSAPEWLYDHRNVSDKSDVYSFGIILLELVSGKRVFDSSRGSEKAYLPNWAYSQVAQGKAQQLIDPRLRDFNAVEAVRMVEVALCCIQEDVSLRPSVKIAELMIHGDLEVPYYSNGQEFALRMQSKLMDENAGILKAAFSSVLKASRKFTPFELERPFSGKL